MGNSSSADVHAEWKNGTECCHSRKDYKVKELRWIRVPMASGFATGASEVGRWTAGILTLGFTAGVWGPAAGHGIKDLSHECIEIVYTCEKCAPGNWQRFTAEIVAKRETHFLCGYYSIEKDARKTDKLESMTVADVEAHYNTMRSDYSLAFDNCCHWSRDLWRKLQSGPCEAPPSVTYYEWNGRIVERNERVIEVMKWLNSRTDSERSKMGSYNK